MVGRKCERKQLEEAFASAVRMRKCGLVTLVGAAGVGKSRLAREFLHEVGATVAEGRCLSYGDGITYWPAIEVVKQLGPALHELAIQNPPAADALRALLGEIEAVTTPTEIASSVRRLFELAARDRPLVVVFDDVHWGEDVFLDLVLHVAHRASEASILLVCLARLELLERRPDWAESKPEATTISVEPLDSCDTDSLIGSLASGAELEPGLVARIHAAAAGNPLFVEEMLAMLRESGGSDVIVPPTIRALLAARLDQLESRERSVLERGSIEGEVFHMSAVEALATPPAPAERHLAALVRKQLVQPERPQLGVGAAYRFRHLLIRDAAYEALTKTERAALHERFADWLAGTGAELVDEIVGYHLEQAYRYQAQLGAADETLAARAAELLAGAGRTARQRGDYLAAAALFSRAADLDAAGRPGLLPDLAELLLWRGDVLEATRLLDEAVEAARANADPSLEALAALERAEIALAFGEGSISTDRLIGLANAAAAVLEELGDESRLAEALVIGAIQIANRGRAEEASELLERALGHALRAGDLHRAHLAHLRLYLLKTLGPTPVSDCIEFLKDVPEGLQSTMLWAPEPRIHAAMIAAYSGQFVEARSHYQAAKGIARDLGLVGYLARMATNGGQIELLAGDPVAAEKELRWGLDRLGELGEASSRATIATYLAEALVRQGRDDDAEEILEAGDALMTPDDVDAQARSLAIRATIRARVGEIDEADRIGREAVELAARTDFVMLRADVLLARAEVLGAARNEAGVSAALREALELFERKENVVEADRTRALLAAANVPAG
jgi:tetratricopeptide (TPR) repeat protein